MQFFKNTKGNKFIGTDSHQCMIISLSGTTFNISGYMLPYSRLDGELLQESTYDEFFGAYDRITARFTDVADKRPRGLKALLSDA